MARLTENIPDNLIDYHSAFCHYATLLKAIDDQFDDCYSNALEDPILRSKLDSLLFLVSVLGDYLDIQKINLEYLISQSHNGYLMPK